LSQLVRSNQDCEGIKQGLRSFLEDKRGKFPRLYFLSNEELIDIFGRGCELVPSMISGECMGFISNLFEGIEQLLFRDDNYDVSHMISRDGEKVELIRDVMTHNKNVDTWLHNFDKAMVETIKDFVFSAFE